MFKLSSVQLSEFVSFKLIQLFEKVIEVYCSVTLKIAPSAQQVNSINVPKITVAFNLETLAQ